MKASPQYQTVVSLLYFEASLNVSFSNEVENLSSSFFSVLFIVFIHLILFQLHLRFKIASLMADQLLETTTDATGDFGQSQMNIL